MFRHMAGNIAVPGVKTMQVLMKQKPCARLEASRNGTASLWRMVADYKIYFVDDYEEKIVAYSHKFVNVQQYLLTLDSNIKLPVTWKIHAILFHLPQFLTRVKFGMAQYSEQTMESIHHKMKATFACFWVLEGNSSHRERLFRSVVEFSSTNL
jgi:hypothetical protein